MPRLTYLEMADTLAAELADAETGSRVTSEHELAAAHGVSRPTARAALQELERRYLVRRARGAGTFVHRRVDYIIGPDTPPSWSDAMRAAGHLPTSRLDRRRAQRAGHTLRRQLELPPDSRVTMLVRVSRLDGRTSGLSTSHVPLALAPDLGPRLAAQAASAPGTEAAHISLYHTLKDHYRLDPVRARTTASLEVPPADVARRLALETPEPTWLVESLHRDRDTWRPVEHTRSWLRADTYRVVLQQTTPRPPTPKEAQ